jgi:glucose-6-phosphate isomerase
LRASPSCSCSIPPIPAQVKAFENKIDIANTIFIVSSKSGTTLEPNIFKQYFFERVKEAWARKAGSRFIAMTDPGSKFEQIAEGDRFRHIFFGMAFHRSAGAIRRCRISAWYRPP